MQASAGVDGPASGVEGPASELGLLVLAPSGRDAVLATNVLEQADLPARICADIEAMVNGIGQGAGAALIAEEALTAPAVARLKTMLREQPPWSDFPLIIFMPRTTSALANRRALEAFAELGNVTALERPIHPLTMVSAARAALRARSRQYTARAVLQEREREVKQRDQFLALLGHELRNPLGALRNASKLAAQAAGAARELGRPLGIIDRQIRHLTQLVDDLLDVARVTSGKIVLKPAPVDLGMLARGLVEEVERSSRERRLAVDLHLAADPVVVLGDSVRLEQILNNLLTNALKYTPPGGRIEVAVSGVEEATLRVSDTGVGISADDLPTIFEPFTQASHSLDRSQGGMGLGLSVVRALVRLHGGEVGVSSAGPGRGTEVVVRLPLAREAPAPAQRAEEAAPETPSTRHHILIVEDGADHRESLQELLESEGHRVDTAVDGEQGVEQALSRHPEVALVDIGLPRLDGYEVARRIRAASGSRILLVALTGYGQPEDRARAAAAGFDVHLTKPVDFDALIRLLDTPTG